MNIQVKHDGIEKVAPSFYKEQLPFYLLIALCFFPIMPFGVMSALIILFAVSCIWANYKNFNSHFAKVKLIPLLMNIGFFLGLIVSLSYSENLKFGWRQIERGLPLLIFPVLFLYFPPKLSKQRLQFLGGSFVFANVLFIGYLYFYLVHNASDFEITSREGLILFEGLSDKGFLGQLKELWNGTFYEVHYYAQKSKESLLEVHKTYASQSILWSIMIVAFFSFNKQLSHLKKAGQILLLILLSVVLVYLYSMMNLLLLVVLSPVLLYALLGPIKHRIWITLGSFVVLIGLALTLVFGQNLSSNSYEKYKQYENPLFIFSNIEKMLEKDERNDINNCNIDLLRESPLIGYGVGDVQDSLNSCYQKLSSTPSEGPSIEQQNLNSHNYYAFLGLAGGVITFVLFLMLVLFNSSIAIRNKDLLYLAFILIIAMNLLTENTLGRAYGILFFALFNGILLSKNLSLGTND